jgi:hypothetical protein
VPSFSERGMTSALKVRSRFWLSRLWPGLIVMSKRVTLTLEPVLVPQRLEPASVKQLPTRLLRKKAKKAMGRSSGKIRIDEPTPKAPASTPPSGPRPKILIHCLKRYTRHEYVSSLTTS